MKLYIKYMVSRRCKMVVNEVLLKLGLHHVFIDLGTIEISEDINEEQREILRENLSQSGLELLDDKRKILIDRIKTAIIEMIHHTDEINRVNYSAHISNKIGLDYNYLSDTFSEVNGITIQQFIISHKIEKVKELIIYDELNITEISRKLHYSSVAHLSNQFKKTTGLTPSLFKQLKLKRLSNLEDL